MVHCGGWSVDAVVSIVFSNIYHDEKILIVCLPWKFTGGAFGAAAGGIVGALGAAGLIVGGALSGGKLFIVHQLFSNLWSLPPNRK